MAEAQLFDRIQWHEGMFLTPQHMQQESARVDALVGWQALAGRPAAWGLRRLVIDDALLGAGLLRILLVEAVMPNGMAVRYDAERAQDQRLELDLAPHAAAMAGRDLPVYLVVGSARSLRLPGQPSMFRPLPGELVEDEVSEALAEEVPRMRPNLALMAGAVPGAAFIRLQIMTVRRDDQIVSRGVYQPAQLELWPTSPVCRRARELAASMRARAQFLATQCAAHSSRLEDRLALVELRQRLASLTQNLPLLEATLDAPPVQPLALYLALCAQLGPLTALRPGTVPLLPPPYVHADSQAAFDAVLDELDVLAGAVSQAWRSCTFGFDDGVFALPMRQEWLDERLVVGLRGGDERELAQWMAAATIGSRTFAVALRDRRVPGAGRRMIDEAPELGLRAAPGCVLFEIVPDERCIVADQDLVISNGSAAQNAARPREIVLYIKG